MPDTMEHALGKDAPGVWFDEREETWVYRASSLGLCPRALVQHRLGHPAEPVPRSLMERFEEGKAAEPIIRKIVQARYGWRSLPNPSIYGPLDEDGQPCVELYVGGAVVRAHPDDVMDRVKAPPGDDDEFQVGKRAVVEIKALGESMFKQWERDGPAFMDYWLWQLA